MKGQLLTHTDLSEAEIERILPSFSQRKIQKKELIGRHGEIARNVFFILQGSVRSYLIDLNGKEHTILLGTEGYWMGDLNAFTNNTTTAYNYQALEVTEIASIGISSWNHLMSSEPGFAKYVGVLFRNALIVQQERLVEMFTLSAEQRYEKLFRNRSDLFNRISQKHLASYIGITPEFFSQLRKRAQQ